MFRQTELLHQLEQVCFLGYSDYQVFSDWLDLMLYSLMNNDKEYCNVVMKYEKCKNSGRDAIKHYANAFGLLLQGTKSMNEDVLGSVYMNWNMSNKRTGQFFTPEVLANFMVSVLEPKGRICDPACGSGVFLVEACKQMTRQELDKAEFIGQDIDLLCVKMCALNLCFFNLNGVVIWGDSLAMECKRALQTVRTVYGGLIREVGDMELLKPMVEEMKEEKYKSLFQPMMFIK